MKHTSHSSTIAIASALTFVAFALPVAAATPPNPFEAITNAAPASKHMRATLASTTNAMHAMRQASSTAARDQRMMDHVQKLETKGDTMVDQRVQSLTDLITRVQGMKNVSDAEKTSIISGIQSEVSDLGALKARMASSSTALSTSTLKANLQSITQGNRVYALVEPRIRIITVADRIQTIVGLMTTLSTKLQTTHAAMTASSTATNPSVQALLSDINAKLADATAQSQAAIAEVTPLQPDNGDKTVLASNTATLKDARLKVQAAQKDIESARQDIQKIVVATKK